MTLSSSTKTFLSSSSTMRSAPCRCLPHSRGRNCSLLPVCFSLNGDTTPSSYVTKFTIDLAMSPWQQSKCNKSWEQPSSSYLQSRSCAPPQPSSGLRSKIQSVSLHLTKPSFREVNPYRMSEDILVPGCSPATSLSIFGAPLLMLIKSSVKEHSTKSGA